MTHNLHPYPAYKDSGVLWLGEVPAHWTVSSLGSLIQRTRERNRTDLPLLSVVREKGVILRSTMTDEENHNYVPDDLSNYRVVRRGNLVINKMKSWQGSLGISDYDGIVSPAYFIFNCVFASRHYLHRLLRSKTYVAFFAQASDGIRVDQWDLSIDRMKRIPILAPPPDEQLAIVRYLDHVDCRIRRYIRARQRLIALLNEQKQAMIHQAVTRGLDPNVRFKPSGVEWLGDVPEHWEVVRSKRMFSPRTELAQPDDIQLSATQAYGVISQEEYERRVGRKIVKIFRHLEKRRHVEVDDFVISMRSFQGGLERAWERGCIRSSYVVLKPSQRLCVSYFAQLFKSHGYIGALQATANFIRDGQDLNYDNFCAVDLPWPPLEEQERIAAALDSALAGLVKTAQRAEREITFLREYRTRLIADVVTGKLDVRAAAAALPAEVEEAEPLAEGEALTEGEEPEEDETDVDGEETDA